MKEVERRSRALSDRRRARVTRGRARRKQARQGLPGWLISGSIALAIVAVAALWVFGLPGGGEDTEPVDSSFAVSRDPVVVAGVEVRQPWADRGRIPLETPVEQVYTLRNVGSEAVILGEASIKVLEGC